MKNFSTVCDSNFCDRVWALNQSLSRWSDDYTLNILCLDQKAKDQFDLKVEKNKNISTFFIEDLKREDPILNRSSSNEPS